MRPSEVRELQQELATQGVAFKLTEWPARATYYKADGEPMPGLPADPFHMKKYLARGFTLMPPLPRVEPKVVEVSDFTCPNCGRPCAGHLGLFAHRRACDKREET